MRGRPTRFLVPAGCGKDGRRGVEDRSKAAKFYGVDYVISGESERWNRVHQRDRRLKVKRPRSPMSQQDVNQHASGSAPPQVPASTSAGLGTRDARRIQTALLCTY